MSTKKQRGVVNRLLTLAFRQEVFITAVNAIVGWIIYNVLIDIYGFSWLHAAVFGVIGYVGQVLMFRWMLSFMRQIEEEAEIRIEKQRKLTDFLKQEENAPQEKQT
ncbi:MAG: hypothetical protein QW514_00010 [Thermoprotei archaeon]